jgi:uncharacterized protein YbbK (DUF523 family)
MRKILISACLYGHAVRYDGKAKRLSDEIFEKWQQEGRLIPVCPEVEGGLPVPREPSEITGDRVVNSQGKDVTSEYIKGAEYALKLADEEQIAFAVMKEGSPACGSNSIYDGSFAGTKIAGEGMAVRLLRQNGYEVFNELQLEQAQALLDEIEEDDELGEFLFNIQV